MEFWIRGTCLAPQHLLALARKAEHLGFGGVTLGEHLFHPRDAASKYPYAHGFAEHDQVPWPEVWSSFAAMAAVTDRLRFTAAVGVVPLRDPLWLAKQVSTVAVLSGDRVILGGGVGWLAEEFEAVGRDFHRRGRLMDEALEACRRIWAGGYVEFQGEEIAFPPLSMSPVPDREIPIWIGGASDAALHRAARWDGWVGGRYGLEEAGTQIARLNGFRELAGTQDRDDYVASVLFDTVPTPEDVAALEALGYSIVVVAPWWADGAGMFDSPELSLIEESMERFAHEVMAPA